MPERDIEQQEDGFGGDIPKPPPKKGSGRIVLLLIPMLLIQAAASYYLVMHYLRPLMPEKEPPPVEESTEEAPKKKAPYGLEYALQDMTANIFDGARTRFLVFNATMETDDASTADELKQRDRQLKDMFLREMSRFSIDMLQDVTMRDSIAEQMRAKVNDLLIHDKVRHIYFDQWIVN